MVSDEGRENWLIERLEKIGAIQSGHFVGKSGLHLDRYVVKDLITSDPVLLDELANLSVLINDRNWGNQVELVVSPAIGAIVLGGMVAHHLGCRFAFTEKDSDGVHKIRDSFRKLVRPNSKVLVVEDIITSGNTVREVVSLVRDQGAYVIGASALWVRGKDVTTDFHLVSLIQKTLPDWSEESCPLCKDRVPFKLELGHADDFLSKYGATPSWWPANR